MPLIMVLYTAERKTCQGIYKWRWGSEYLGRNIPSLRNTNCSSVIFSRSRLHYCQFSLEILLLASCTKSTARLLECRKIAPPRSCVTGYCDDGLVRLKEHNNCRKSSGGCQQAKSEVEAGVVSVVSESAWKDLSSSVYNLRFRHRYSRLWTTSQTNSSNL